VGSVRGGGFEVEFGNGVLGMVVVETVDRGSVVMMGFVVGFLVKGRKVILYAIDKRRRAEGMVVLLFVTVERRMTKVVFVGGVTKMMSLRRMT
jgi:hypothetical protein